MFFTLCCPRCSLLAPRHLYAAGTVCGDFASRRCPTQVEKLKAHEANIMQLLQRGEEEGVVSQQMAERNVVEKAAAKEASPESGDAASLVSANEIEVRKHVFFFFSFPFQHMYILYIASHRCKHLPCHYRFLCLAL